jgi:hypothetical protein
MSTPQETPQERFDRQYITCGEIMQRLNVANSVVLNARKRGYLPDPIYVVQSFIWERETCEPFLQAWKVTLDVKRANRHP